MEEFVYLRPVFKSILASSILVMLGFIADEYSLGGDVQSSNMFIGIVLISGLNFIIYYKRK